MLMSDQVHGEGALRLGCHCPEDSQLLPDGQLIRGKDDAGWDLGAKP